MSQKISLRSPNGDIQSILRSLRGVEPEEEDVLNDWLSEISIQLTDVEQKTERRRGLLLQAESSIRELKHLLELPTLLRAAAEARLNLLSTQRTELTKRLESESKGDQGEKEEEDRRRTNSYGLSSSLSEKEAFYSHAEEVLKGLNVAIIRETTSITQLDDLMRPSVLSLSQDETTAESLKRSISEHEKFASSLRREIGDFTGSNEGSYPHIWRQIFFHAVEWSPRENESDEETSTPKDFEALYALRLSHVCRLWRRICLGHSALWDKIVLRDYMSSAQASKWIAFQAEHVRTKSISFELSRTDMRYGLTGYDARVSSDVVYSGLFGNIVKGDDEGYCMYDLRHINKLSISGPSDVIVPLVSLSTWNIDSLSLYNVTAAIQPAVASKLTNLSVTFSFQPEESFLSSIFAMTTHVTTLHLYYPNRSPLRFDVTIPLAVLPHLHHFSASYGLLCSRIFISEEHCINRLSITGEVDEDHINSDDPTTENEEVTAPLWNDILSHSPGLADSVSDLEIRPSNSPFLNHTITIQLIQSFNRLHTLRYCSPDFFDFVQEFMRSSQEKFSLEELHLSEANLGDGVLFQFLEKENIQ
ncbi:hypothetical protein FRC17_007523, partial [Serendipita sp. 399]